MVNPTYEVEIPLKLPSCNEYINECRNNKYGAAKLKYETESEIGYYLRHLPEITKPVYLRFYWIEGNKRRDLDGIAFGKKFILDALVRFGKLKNDNHRYVKGFSDIFDYDS